MNKVNIFCSARKEGKYLLRGNCFENALLEELETYIDRLEINHKKEFSKGIVHVNTIEGFWSYIKNGIRGSYKAISKKYLPFYLVEFEWKFNHRLYKGNEFEAFLISALNQEKELEYWKAKSTQQVKNISYGQ